MVVINKNIYLGAAKPGSAGGSSLPDQDGHSGEFLTTDGTDASWGAVSEVPSTTGATEGDVLTVDSNGDPAWTTPSGGGLPDQTGQSGKFLTTDGTDASWSDKPLVNSTTETSSLTILGTAATGNFCTNVGTSSQGSSFGGVAYGYNARALGYKQGSTPYSQKTIAVGSSASAGSTVADASYAIAIGNNAAATAYGAIQINVSVNGHANTDTNTVKIANDNGNFEIMSADGTVPHARLTNAVVSNSITIAVADWNGGTTCTKMVSGLTATSTVWVAPDNASQSDYLTAGVYASAQATDSITFTATTTPTSALTVNVIYC